jgi:hypothetical protein
MVTMAKRGTPHLFDTIDFPSESGPGLARANQLPPGKKFAAASPTNYCMGKERRENVGSSKALMT